MREFIPVSLDSEPETVVSHVCSRSLSQEDTQASSFDSALDVCVESRAGTLSFTFGDAKPFMFVHIVDAV